MHEAEYLFDLENQEWAVYLDTIQNKTPLSDMPHVWRLGWCADYADENNWVHEVFNAQAGANRLRRNCTDAVCSDSTASEFDELTVAAQASQDPAERAALYEQAEIILAGSQPHRMMSLELSMSSRLCPTMTDPYWVKDAQTAPSDEMLP